MRMFTALGITALLCALPAHAQTTTWTLPPQEGASPAKPMDFRILPILQKSESWNTPGLEPEDIRSVSVRTVSNLARRRRLVVMEQDMTGGWKGLVFVQSLPNRPSRPSLGIVQEF